MVDEDWTTKYRDKTVTAIEAIKKIQRGQRIFLGTGCGVPYHLVQELSKNANMKTTKIFFVFIVLFSLLH